MMLQKNNIFIPYHGCFYLMSDFVHYCPSAVKFSAQLSGHYISHVMSSFLKYKLAKSSS